MRSIPQGVGRGGGRAQGVVGAELGQGVVCQIHWKRPKKSPWRKHMVVLMANKSMGEALDRELFVVDLARFLAIRGL